MQAYSIYDREVGYCQGSCFVVGLLLMEVSQCVYCRRCVCTHKLPRSIFRIKIFMHKKDPRQRAQVYFARKFLRIRHMR